MHTYICIYMYTQTASDNDTLAITPNLPTTKIIPTRISWHKLSGNFSMGLGIPPLDIKSMLESNPLKSRILVRRLAVHLLTGT